MSMLNRLRNRRNSVRSARAIERALRATSSRSVRDEILIAAQRYYG